MPLQEQQIVTDRPVRRRRVTIADVADYLGVTKGTVSRALNGYGDIAKSTQMRVRKAAETLGYSPLAQAQAIRTGRARSVGLVLQVADHDRQRPFLTDFLAGISEAASSAGWTLTMATANSDSDSLRLMERLKAERKADGFILPRTYEKDARIAYLREAEIPFVLYGRTGDPRGCAWFDIESEAATAQAVEILAGLGHRRIGFVPGGQGYMFSRLRLEGYCNGLKRVGYDADPVLIGSPAKTRAEGATAAGALLRLDEPPSAIVCATDAAAIGVYDAADSAGLEIGSDLSVISYDGLPEGAVLSPSLSTFAVDLRHAGTRLAELLIRRIRGEPVTDLRALSRARFLDRQSHGIPALSPAAIADRVAGHHHPGRTT